MSLKFIFLHFSSILSSPSLAPLYARDWHASFNFSFCNLFSLVGISISSLFQARKLSDDDWETQRNSFFGKFSFWDYNTPQTQKKSSKNHAIFLSAERLCAPPKKSVARVNRIPSRRSKVKRKRARFSVVRRVSECGEKGRKRKFPMWIKHVVAQPVSMW